jgi:hypothetical protein
LETVARLWILVYSGDKGSVVQQVSPMEKELTMTPKYAARTYGLNDGVVIVKQTILKSGRYVVCCDERGNHRERHIDPGPTQNQGVGQAILDAHNGLL